MTQETVDHGDHSHTQLELQLATENARLRDTLMMVASSDRLVRTALLQLLPNQGDAVTVTFDVTQKGASPIVDDEGNQVPVITLFRDGDALDIRLGA